MLRTGTRETEVGRAHAAQLQDEFHHAHLKALPGFQHRLADSFAFHESTIGRANIANADRILFQNNFAVVGRDGRVFDLKVIFASASKPVRPHPQINELRGNFNAFNPHSWHS